MKLRQKFATTAVAILLLSCVANAQSPPELTKRDEGAALEQRKFEHQQKLDSEKLAVEAQKLKLESDKLALERGIEEYKAWTTAYSVAVPLVVVFVTVVGGIITLWVQSRNDRRLKEEDVRSAFKLKEKDVKSAFELKAAEIVMEGGNPLATKGKATALATLFQDSLPATFGSAFDPSIYGDGFALTRDPDAKKLQEIGPPASAGIKDIGAKSAPADPSHEALKQAWFDEIEARRELFLGYVYQRSKRANQEYDVTIILMRHVWGKEPNQRRFNNVENALFYFGSAWGGGEVFVADQSEKTGRFVGVRISAWGSFWATCRVKFKDDPNPVILHRHIDFEMPPYDA